MISCKNCGLSLDGNYCNNCGEAATLKRMNTHYLSHELLHLLHFEKGFFYTVKELALRPGKSIKTFITENRKLHMKPIPFLILTSLIYTVVAHYLKVDTVNDRKFESSKHTAAIFHWVNAHYGYANIFMSAVTAGFVYLFFKKYKFNFVEVLVLMCFIVGQGMLLNAVICTLHSFVPKLVYGLLMSFGIFLYASWAIGQFFQSGKIGGYLKAVSAYFCGYFLFYVLIVFIGVSLDLLTGTPVEF